MPETKFDLFTIITNGMNIALSGAAISFVFVLFLAACMVSPEIQGIGGIAASLVLYIAVERLTKNTGYMFVGILYLAMVGALGAGIAIAGFPEGRIPYTEMITPTLVMLGLLSALSIAQYIINQVFLAFRGPRDSETGETDTSETIMAQST